MPVTGHVIVGPAQHGVVTFAEGLAAHDGGPSVTVAAVPTGAELRFLVRNTDVVHLQFTDALYGRDCAEAAARFTGLVAGLPGPVTVTVHDLPDPDDDPARYQRRAAAYRSVVGAVDAVAVSSRHEARLLGILGGGPARVIPLPVEPGPPSGPPDLAPEVGVLGFVHPGKGHAEALAELAGVGRALAFTAIGRAADGHAELVEELRARAAALGHDWGITGFVTAADLPARLRRVAVPLAPGRLVSASGSVNTWLANGRRPLVLDGPYAREIAEERPGTIRLYRDGTLAAAVLDALADPASMWLPPGVDIGPGPADAARAYRELWGEVAARRVSRV